MLTNKQKNAKEILEHHKLNYDKYPNRNEYSYLVIYTSIIGGKTSKEWAYYYDTEGVQRFMNKCIWLHTIGIDHIYSLESGMELGENFEEHPDRYQHWR